MTSVSAKSVASLRSRTGVSMMQCKNALEEAGGDEDKAIEILRKSGAAQAAKKAERDQKEGIVFSAQKDGKAGLIILHCETDFVARDENFQKAGKELAELLVHEGMDAVTKKAEEMMPVLVQKLGENISLGNMELTEAAVSGVYVHTNGKIGVIVGLEGGSEELARDAAMHAAAMGPAFVSPDDVPETEVNKEKEIWNDQLSNEGKPAEIVEKIMMGKEKKFREENALLTQDFVKDPGKTVGAHLGDAKVTAYVRMAI